MTTVAEFLLDTPLYEPVACSFKANSVDPLLDLFMGRIIFDGHCPNCRQRTTWTKEAVFGSGVSPSHLPIMIPYKEFEITCARDANHKIKFFVRLTADSATKIGQYPSLADVANDEARVFDKYLNPIDRAELHRAIGLAAHGIGIGSFTYLRRVFERLLFRTFETNREANGWTTEEWSRKRTGERIRLMKAFLPDFLNDTPALHSILSKGIHELSEDECNAAFSVLKYAILEILEEESRQRKRRDEREIAKKAIAELEAKLAK